MLKIAASIVACVALLGLVNPASGLVVPSTSDAMTVEFCDKGDKKKKEIEKPAESQVEFCDKGKKGKGEIEKPAESQIELCKKDGKKGDCKGKKGDREGGAETAG